MDYETIKTSLKTFLDNQQAIYTAIGITCTAAGYLIGSRLQRRNFRLKELEQAAKISEAEAQKAEYDCQKQISSNTLETEKLKYANVEILHKQSMEVKDKEHARKLEDLTLAKEDEQTHHARKLELAKQLAELKPLFQEYLASSQTNSRQPNEDYLSDGC